MTTDERKEEDEENNADISDTNKGFFTIAENDELEESRESSLVMN